MNLHLNFCKSDLARL